MGTSDGSKITAVAGGRRRGRSRENLQGVALGASDAYPEANEEKGMNSRREESEHETAAAHTAMRMSQRCASVEVADGAAWIEGPAPLGDGAQRDIGGVTGMRREAAVVTFGTQGVIRPVP